MNPFFSLTFLFFMTILYQTNAQWYVIKKDYPSNYMPYPNPGKRSISDDKFNIDCSIPPSALQSHQEKMAWLLLCQNQISSLTEVDDSSSSLNSIEDELYSTPQLISHERRTVRSSPPYMNDEPGLFNIRLLKRLRRSSNK
jgi:hypothetical protein